MLSARVADPQLIPLWIANPQGRANNPQGQMLLIKFRPLAKKRVENLCPRGFAIPEVVIADMLSARVTDPQLLSLWITNPQGQERLFYRN